MDKGPHGRRRMAHKAHDGNDVGLLGCEKKKRGSLPRLDVKLQQRARHRGSGSGRDRRRRPEVEDDGGGVRVKEMAAQRHEFELE
jgi:hypothetical protein